MEQSFQIRYGYCDILLSSTKQKNILTKAIETTIFHNLVIRRRNGKPQSRYFSTALFKWNILFCWSPKNRTIYQFMNCTILCSETSACLGRRRQKIAIRFSDSWKQSLSYSPKIGIPIILLSWSMIFWLVLRFGWVPWVSGYLWTSIGSQWLYLTIWRIWMAKCYVPRNQDG